MLRIGEECERIIAGGWESFARWVGDKLTVEVNRAWRFESSIGSGRSGLRVIV